ncbi:glycosyltransferase [Candidatus Woesearchaeota archaeon]|nr:glycosyltransferase [Candidatus Woesearchaeota archaeon]
MLLITEIILRGMYLTSLFFIVFWLLLYLSYRSNIKKQNKKVRNPSSYPKVTVVIPAYNEETSIVGSVESVLELNYPKDNVEIIIVDDGSSDNTSKRANDVIKRNPNRNIQLIKQKNKGKAHALNNAMKASKGELFVCLDADSYVDKDTLRKMVHMYQTEPDLAAIVPAMKVRNPRTLIQKIQRAEYINSLLLIRLMSYMNCLYVTPGPFSLYKLDVLKKLGGFDETNLTEDQEIAYRMQESHYRIKHCPSAFVYTNSPDTIKGLYHQRNRWFSGSVQNIIKYRRLIFNREYGDFGLFQLPLNVSAFLLAFGIVAFFINFSIVPFFKELKNLYLVGFDITPYLKDFFKFNMNILDFNISFQFIIAIIFLAAIIVILIAHRNSEAAVFKYGWIYIIPYLIFYYIFLSFIAVIVVVEMLIGRRKEW